MAEDRSEVVVCHRCSIKKEADSLLLRAAQTVRWLFAQPVRPSFSGPQ